MYLDQCIRKLSEDKHETEVRNNKERYNSIYMKFEGYGRGGCDGRILDIMKIPTDEYIEMSRLNILGGYRVEEITEDFATLKLIDKRK